MHQKQHLGLLKIIMSKVAPLIVPIETQLVVASVVSDVHLAHCSSIQGL